jgi:hypothetical protein
MTSRLRIPVFLTNFDVLDSNKENSIMRVNAKNKFLVIAFMALYPSVALAGNGALGNWPIKKDFMDVVIPSPNLKR